MDPLHHASPDSNVPGHMVTWLCIDPSDENMMPDPGVPYAAALVRLGGRGEGGLGQAGESGVSVQLCSGSWTLGSIFTCLDGFLG